MIIVAVLCYVGRLFFLIFAYIMAWFINRLYPVVDWLRRTLTFFWRCMRRMVTSTVGFPFLRMRGGKDPGESEVNDEENISEKSRQQDLETPPSECQHEAAAGKRSADFSREHTNKRQKTQEDIETDDESDSEYVKTTDEFYCGYDSTWETKEEQQSPPMRPRRYATSTNYKFSRFESAARDMQNYRHDYPSQRRPQHRMKPASDDKPNLSFYLGKTPSRPDGVYIHNFHEEWRGEYDTLEFVHSYIQWLFPLQEPGMNYEASTLTKEEIEVFTQDTTAKANLLKSYELMLDFYGIKLCNKQTGEVQRAPNWKERFQNLNSHTHNNLRITRILKCLGTLGFPEYQAPLVRFFLQETLVNRELPNVKDSVLSYFLFAVLDKTQRRSLLKFAYQNYDRKDEFVWCPKKIQMKWSKLSVSKTQEGVNDKEDTCELDLNPSLEYLSLGKEDDTKDKEN
ncbi:opioid growth factor receptor-like [Centropristis striata]|uniref:opioid growth factor receptor-like n=1 Tax=Centropristis striata TaxID=184440 RepID=UPI0027E13812|nr:opioid growth factor receptor-like [Centropristis striata]